MRITRVFTMLTAMLLAVIVGLTTGSTTAAHAEGAERAKPAHVIQKLQAGEIRNSGRFYVQGKAITYKRKVVKLQRKRGGEWRTVKGDRTSATGKFRITFRGPCGSKWRIVLKATATRANTKRVIGRIVCG